MMKLDMKNLPSLRVAHHLDHVAAMCHTLANTLEAFIGEGGDDIDADNVCESLRETAEDAAMASDSILEALK